MAALILLLLLGTAHGQSVVADPPLPVGSVTAYAMFDSTLIVATAKDTSDGVVVAGADLFGYYTRYSSPTTVGVFSYIDISPDGRKWFPFQTAAIDSLFSATSEDSLTHQRLNSFPDDAVYARARLVGNVAANQTVTSWVWWVIVYTGTEGMR